MPRNRKRRSSFRRILAPLLWAAFCPAFLAHSAAADTLSAELLRARLSPLSGWLAADLDGDHQPDFARTGRFRRDGTDYVQEIRFGFSAFESGSIFVRTSGIATRLVARDVDGDADRDLILQTLSGEPLAVLLNDGGGNFHQGDLETFRSQLSREQRSVDSSRPATPNPDAGDFTYNPALTPCGAGHVSERAGAGISALYDRNHPKHHAASHYTRGPPLQS